MSTGSIVVDSRPKGIIGGLTRGSKIERVKVRQKSRRQSSTEKTRV